MTLCPCTRKSGSFRGPCSVGLRINARCRVGWGSWRFWACALRAWPMLPLQRNISTSGCVARAPDGAVIPHARRGTCCAIVPTWPDFIGPPFEHLAPSVCVFAQRSSQFTSTPFVRDKFARVECIRVVLPIDVATLSGRQVSCASCNVASRQWLPDGQQCGVPVTTLESLIHPSARRLTNPSLLCLLCRALPNPRHPTQASSSPCRCVQVCA